jgi:hypothetical protein
MTAGSATFLWLLLGATAAPEPTNYAPAPPIASVTLLVEGATNSVEILNETNLTVNIVPAEYQDLQINRSIALECFLRYNGGLSSIRARADNKHNLIPLDVVAYKTYDPSYIKLQINTEYFTDSIYPDLGEHKVYIEFFANP